MRLKHLLLHNYRQHKDLDQDLDGHIIGVIGPNGSGKSNLMGALQYAFSGEQPGADKKDLLRWGAAEGFVELRFEHNDIQGGIRRSVNSMHAIMQYGTDTYNGIKNVNAAVEQLFGMDKDLLKQTIFVRQAEIDSVLFTDPRVRELAFQRLCGIGDAAKVHKRLGELIGGLETVQDFDSQIADGIARRQEMQTRLEGLQKQYAGMPVLPDIEVMQRQVYTLLRARTNAENLRTLYGQQHSAEAQRQILTDQLSRLVIPPVELQELDNRITELHQLVNAAERYASAYHDYEEANRSVQQLTQPTSQPLPFTDPQLQDLRTKVDEYAAKYSTAASNLSLYRSLANVLANVKTADCPVCGAPIRDMTRLTSQIQRFEEEARASAPDTLKHQLQTALQQQQTVDWANKQNKAQYDAQYTERTRRLAQASALCQQLQRVEQSAEQLRATLTELTAQRTQVANLRTQHIRLTTELAGADKNINRILVDIGTLVTELKPWHPTVEEQAVDTYITAFSSQVDQLNQDIAQVRKLSEQYSGLNGMIQELGLSLKTLDSTIELLKKKREDQTVRREVVSTLTAVRDWFHYLNGPHAITANVLEEMTADVNRFLTLFNAPFVVQPAPDVMGYRVLFIDTRDKSAEAPDASVLSGGQRVMLATAFRFASYVVFASKTGILFLDEPSAYLDSAAVGYLGILLERISEIAKQMNLQIGVITHERELMPRFDRIIDLGAADDLRAEIAV